MIKRTSKKDGRTVYVTENQFDGAACSTLNKYFEQVTVDGKTAYKVRPWAAKIEAILDAAVVDYTEAKRSGQQIVLSLMSVKI